MTQIETPNLLLKYLTPNDASSEYATWLNDTEINQFLEVRHTTHTVDSCKEFIKECENDPNSYLYGIFTKSNERHIGNVKVGFINNLYKRGEVSLFIGDKNYWGKGYATEVVRAITQHSVNNLGLTKLEAGCYENNLNSLRVFLKNGYVVEGFFRSHIVSKGNRIGCFWVGFLANDFTK